MSPELWENSARAVILIWRHPITPIYNHFRNFAIYKNNRVVKQNKNSTFAFNEIIFYPKALHKFNNCSNCCLKILNFIVFNLCVKLQNVILHECSQKKKGDMLEICKTIMQSFSNTQLDQELKTAVEIQFKNLFGDDWNLPWNDLLWVNVGWPILRVSDWWHLLWVSVWWRLLRVSDWWRLLVAH